MIAQITITLLIAAALTSPTTPAPAPDGATVEAELRAKDQALLDALAPGDRGVWERTLSEDAVYVDENGAVMDRAAFLKALTPLPEGISGTISITQYQVRLWKDNAFVIHHDEETENFHGQMLSAHYLMTETWRSVDGQWKLAAAHAYVVNDDPPSVQLPIATLQQYLGRYEASPGLHFVVDLRGDTLVGGVEGSVPQPLLAEAPDVFFVKGQPRKRLIFERGAGSNNATMLRSRREGHDIVWRRVP